MSEEEFLDRYPKDEPAPNIFFVDESSAKAAVAAAYQPWTRSSSMYQRDLVIMFDGMSDDGHWRPSRGASIQQSEWNITPEHGTIRNYWRYAYQSVNAANYAIEKIPTLLEKGMTQEELDPYIAEAHFVRGFSYLFLVNFFGEVPLIESPLSSMAEFEQPKSSTDQIYERIINDFTLAREKLPEEWPTSYTGSATKATAAAYLAKTQLYREDFTAAETAARSAIEIAENTGYHLVDDYMSIFDINNEANPELLFYIPYIEADDYGANYMVQRLSRDLPPELSHIWGVSGWGYHLPQRDLYEAYEEGDPRREYTIFSTGDAFGVYNAGEPLTYTHERYNDSGELVTYDSTYTAGDTVAYDYRWSPTGMNVRKDIYNIGHLPNERWAGKDVPLMRMADLYLILAEALAEQGNNEALVWVNKVRARPSVDMPPKTAADGSLVELVRHERRVELALEGQRLWDLVRWGEMKNIFGDGTRVKRHFYSDYLPLDHSDRFDNPNLDNYPGDLVLFPIPQNELDQNSEINEQNPGY
ncbi:RagB/SusD family nutrient uptake outer membrane protein [Fodinibius sediminis]|nr:RagB/SusD family nutrient uptake outer membrane protein [Fodinibius sediminis]